MNNAQTTPLAGLRQQVHTAEALISDKLPALAAAQLHEIARHAGELAQALGIAALESSRIHAALERPPLGHVLAHRSQAIGEEAA